jgi:hypothetical protein
LPNNWIDNTAHNKPPQFIADLANPKGNQLKNNVFSRDHGEPTKHKASPVTTSGGFRQRSLFLPSNSTKTGDLSTLT